MAKSPTLKELKTLDRAQELVYEAWESSKRIKIILARQALNISPLCADAHLILAITAAEGSEARLGGLRQAVDAGRKAIGETAFAEMEGQFWGFLETRPYMRARHFLATELLKTGMLREAITEMRDMLRLNPNDNQGIRHILSDCLIAAGDEAGAAGLRLSYRDDISAVFTWNDVLLSYRKHGDSKKTSAALAKALKWNKHVPAFLTGARKLSKSGPDFIEMGGRSEATEYAQHALANWQKTPGAVAWLKGQLPEVKQDKFS